MGAGIPKPENTVCGSKSWKIFEQFCWLYAEFLSKISFMGLKPISHWAFQSLELFWYLHPFQIYDQFSMESQKSFAPQYTKLRKIFWYLGLEIFFSKTKFSCWFQKCNYFLPQTKNKKVYLVTPLFARFEKLDYWL